MNSAGLAEGDAPSTPEPPRDTRGRVLLVTLALSGLTILLAQVVLVAGRSLPFSDGLLLALVLPATFLGLVVLLARLEHRSLRDLGFRRGRAPLAALVFSVLLVLAFLVAEMYPGFLFGFGRLPPPTVLEFGYALFTAPFVALGQEALFRGYVFRRLSRVVPLTSAMVVSAAAFALQSTNFVTLGSLGTVTGTEYLFGTTVGNLVLGLVLSVLFYKTGWSLLAPVATRTGLLWMASLLPVVAASPNWQTSFGILLLGYGVLFGLVTVGLREPRLQAHAYLGESFGPRRLRFRERARNRRELRSGAIGVAALAVVFLATTQIAPVALGASPPLLAIASGSMVPTFHRGTMVVLAHASPGQIHVGTIIAFHVSCLPAPTVHRVYKVVTGGASPVFLTKGDANPSPDPCTVPYANVIGRVVANVPYLGLLVLDPILDVALVALIIVVAFLVPRRDR